MQHSKINKEKYLYTSRVEAEKLNISCFREREKQNILFN